MVPSFNTRRYQHGWTAGALLLFRTGLVIPYKTPQILCGVHGSEDRINWVMQSFATIARELSNELYAHNYTWIHTNLYNDMKNIMSYHMKRHVIYDVYDVWHMVVWSMVCNIKTGMYFWV